MTRDPDLEGRGYQVRFDVGQLPKTEVTGPWRAWRNRFSDLTRKQWPAGRETWLLHAPGAHPLWHWHSVSAVALRDFPGVPPAKLQAVGNSHEIMIAAIDPKWDPMPHIDRLEVSDYGRSQLQPMNLVHQVSALNDEQCDELVFLLVRGFVQGLSSPDDDFRTRNIELITATADHLRRGMHMPS